MKLKKHFKKFILVLVVLILFNFCCPRRVQALELAEDLLALPARILYFMEKGTLKIMNNLFTNEAKQSREETRNSEYDAISLQIWLTPETIIKGKFLLMDANIFKSLSNTSNYYDDGAFDGAINSGKESLRGIISGWYYALRNFAIVALLSVLVYVGIRMVLSTLAQDKAKYKMMFKDWLVALCLLIAMNYIMIGTLQLSSMVTDAIGSSGHNSNMVGKLTEIISGVLSESSSEDENGNEHALYRYYLYEYTDPDTGETTKYDIGDAYALILVLMGIIIFTVIFAIKYLKREFTIIFLILLGPVSCITYPIDKIGDGKAQAFNRWLSEFIYQVIIQPFHLLLYIVLVGTAVELADKNVIYALVSFGVMIPAEKFIKQMFGFRDSLGSPLGNMMKAGLARDMLNKATSRFMGGKGGSTASAGGGNIRENTNNLPQRTPTRGTDYAMLGGNNGDGQSGSSSQRLNTQTQPGENQDPRQAMLDVYDENFGSPDYDPQEREAMANELPADNRLSYSEEDLRESGLDEETIAQIMGNTQETAGDAATIAAIDAVDNGNERINGETEGDRAQESQEQQRRLRDMLRHPIQTFDNSDFGKKHNQRVSAKYGTTSRGKRWLKRTPKIIKGAFKGTGKLAKAVAFTTATIGAAGYAAVTGNGAEAAGIIAGAAGIAASRGTRAIKGVARNGARFVRSTAQDYYRSGAIPLQHRAENNIIASALRLDSGSRDFARFESDPEQQRRAADAFRLNNEREANREELRNELRDRFALSQIRGMNADLIDKSVGRYQELKEISGMSDARAANQAAIEAQLGDAYKGKFGKQKDVEDMIKAQTKIFESEGYEHAAAEQSAINLIAGAAKMNKESLVLPEGKQVVEVPIKVPNVATNLGIQGTDVEMQRVNELTIKLMEMDYTPSEIQRIATSVSTTPGEGTVIEKYNAKVEFIENQQNSARRRVARAKNVDTNQVTLQEIKTEVGSAIELREKYRVAEDKIDSARKIDRKLEQKPGLTIGRTKRAVTQKELTWEKAAEIKGMSNAQIEEVEKKLAKEIERGGTSSETAKNDAKNIMKEARKLEAKTE